MRNAAEFRDHARYCRDLAALMEREDQRKLLLKMARDWEEMADFREGLVARHPELRSDAD